MRGGARGAAQFHQVMLGLLMIPLNHHVEVIFTENDTTNDTTEPGRLRDAEATFRPTPAALRAIDLEFSKLLSR